MAAGMIARRFYYLLVDHLEKYKCFCSAAISSCVCAYLFSQLSRDEKPSEHVMYMLPIVF